MALLTGRVWAPVTLAARTSTSPAHVAVAFFSSSGPSVLPLRPGSTLVVNISEQTLRTGGTDPSAIQTMIKRGVSVFGQSTLHAKLFVFDDLMFVGSNNASTRSRDVLHEATMQSMDAAEIRAARDYVRSLCVTPVDISHIQSLRRVYKPPALRDRASGLFATMLMDLTGESRGTQVQPPMPIWEHFFGISINTRPYPIIRMLSEHDTFAGFQRRRVVLHHHTLTVEVPEAKLPRPAIMRIQNLARKTRYL